MQFAFSKYSGCGNDFILIDNRNVKFPVSDACLISKICNRREGIGADGIILLENSHLADFRMRIFNADGSEAEMCGNGIRCLAKFIQEDRAENNCQYEIETLERKLQVTLEDGLVKVHMGDPTDSRWNLKVTVADTIYTGHYLNTGVPHFVIFTDNIASIPVVQLGASLRWHPDFQPKGTNVNFVQKIKDNLIRVRTYERGVENETPACGTGITASALAAGYLFNLPAPIQVLTSTDETIEVDFKSLSQVTQKGPAKQIFKGSFYL